MTSMLVSISQERHFVQIVTYHSNQNMFKVDYIGTIKFLAHTLYKNIILAEPQNSKFFQTWV